MGPVHDWESWPMKGPLFLSLSNRENGGVWLQGLKQLYSASPRLSPSQSPGIRQTNIQHPNPFLHRRELSEPRHVERDRQADKEREAVRWLAVQVLVRPLRPAAHRHIGFPHQGRAFPLHTRLRHCRLCSPRFRHPRVHHKTLLRLGLREFPHSIGLVLH